MLELEWGATPIVATLIVVFIGIFGVISALVAGAGIGRERLMLKRGVDALHDAPVDHAVSFDYRQWVNERPELLDTHFADHLLFAWAAAKSERSVSLHELQQVSARREARRSSARLTGGITGLLLVCGIAGTLLAIKPILGGFNIVANSEGVFEAAESAFTATKMIRDLGQAFLPSLVALIGTVVVVFLRGVYAHRRGTLAGELDVLDLEVLFPRFRPPSLSREFDEVRVSLGELVTTMLASQRNFDGFVKRLSDAAKDFRSEAPDMGQAATRFASAAEIIAPKLDELLAALPNHLGPEAPLCKRLSSLDVLGTQITATALEMKLNGKTIAKQLDTANRILQQTANDLPAQLENGCIAAATILSDATANAVSAACNDAAHSLDAAAAPVRDAAEAVHAADHALHDQIATSIEVMETDIGETLDTVAHQFKLELQTAVATVTTMHGSVASAIGKLEPMMKEIEKIHLLTAKTLTEQKQDQRENSQIRTNFQSTVGDIDRIGKDLRQLITDLGNAQQTSRLLSDRFGGITSDIDRLTTTTDTLHHELEELGGSQQLAAEQITEVLGRADMVTGNWQTLVKTMTRLSNDNVALNANVGQLLQKGDEVARLLRSGTAEAETQQMKLTERVASLNDVIVRLEEKRQSHWVGRIFRGD